MTLKSDKHNNYMLCITYCSVKYYTKVVCYICLYFYSVGLNLALLGMLHHPDALVTQGV